MITIVGEGNFHDCAEHLVPLLNLNTTCKKQSCSINGVYQPIINYKSQDFYGFSEFWYTMEGLKINLLKLLSLNCFKDVLKIGGPYTRLTFLNASIVSKEE